jgi:hypothetical protein
MNPTTEDILDAGSLKLADEQPRPHLGVSQVGHHCERAIWLGFRWVCKDTIQPTIARTFRLGDYIEEIVVHALIAGGMNITDRQKPVEFPETRYHMRGHIDGIITGVPELPKVPHLLEVKSMKHARFLKLKRQVLEKSNPTYYYQCQAYMHGLDLPWTLLVVMDKDTSEIHTIRFNYDSTAYDAVRYVANYIIDLDEPQIRLSEDPDHFECKWCGKYHWCQKNRGSVPDKNCRTCVSSQPQEDGTWWCVRDNDHVTLTVEAQRKGCGDYRPIPMD